MAYLLKWVTKCVGSITAAVLELSAEAGSHWSCTPSRNYQDLVATLDDGNLPREWRSIQSALAGSCISCDRKPQTYDKAASKCRPRETRENVFPSAFRMLAETFSRTGSVLKNQYGMGK